MKKLYEIPNTDTAYTVEELIGMVQASAIEIKRLEQENFKLKEAFIRNWPSFDFTDLVDTSEQVETTEHQLDLLGGGEG